MNKNAKATSKFIAGAAAGMMALGCAASADAGKSLGKHSKQIYKFNAKTNGGKSVSLKQYKGKVVMIVNTASKCGYTPQYAGLQRLYKKHRKKGFVVLAFPSNDFGGQEPGSNKQIRAFCSKKYHVTFPLFAKVAVKGKKKHPLYRFLTDKKKNGVVGGEIPWNFTKYLIGRDGRVVARFAPGDEPESQKILRAVRKHLARK